MKKRTLKRVTALLMTLLLICMLPISAAAETANAAVNEATSGVVQINALYLDPNNNVWTGYAGTAFLINEEYLLTCDHVFDLSASDIEKGQKDYGWSEKQIREHAKIEVVVVRDVTIEATVINESEIMDFSILKLSQKLYDRTYLPLRSSSDLLQTEEIYSLGFPGGISAWQDANTYTSEDVTITSGRVNKLNTIGTVDYIQHSAQISGGNSGGPLVDENGAVVGINVFTAGSGFESGYSYALAIDQPRQVLDSLGIEYARNTDTPASTEPVESSPVESEPTEEAPSVEVPAEVDKTELRAALTEAGQLDMTLYEDDTQMVEFNSALSTAQRVADNDAATQTDVESAAAALISAQSRLTPKQESNSTLWIILAVAGVVVVAVVVVVIVLLGSRKNAKKAAEVRAAVPTMPVNGGFAPVGVTPVKNATAKVNASPSAYPKTEVLGQGSTETTVLSKENLTSKLGDAGETTLLTRNLGVLTRTRTGEKISVNSEGFVIGRERAKVNYCVSDNTSVGREHLRISSRGDEVVAEDMNSRNGTFINGVKAGAGQLVTLHDGDKITLSDEEFVYHT